MTTERFGFELPLLLVAAFRTIIDELHAELAQHGHDQVRPADGFALQAIGPLGVTVSELARRTGVSKQAAAKAVASLETRGYVERRGHPTDRRAQHIRRTARADDMLRLSADVFERRRRAIGRALGAGRLRQLEDDLATISGPNATMASLADLPGWIT